MRVSKSIGVSCVSNSTIQKNAEVLYYINIWCLGLDRFSLVRFGVCRTMAHGSCSFMWMAVCYLVCSEWQESLPEEAWTVDKSIRGVGK